MSEETNNTEAEEVAVPAAEAKPETPAAAPAAKPDEKSAKTDEKAAPAAEAAAVPALNPDGTPKKEAKKDIFAEIGGGEEEIKIHKAKGSKNIARGIVHVTATFNNTLVSVTDPNGNSHRLVQRRQDGLQGFAEKHRICGTGCFPGCMPPGHGSRLERGRCPRQGARLRS